MKPEGEMVTGAAGPGWGLVLCGLSPRAEPGAGAGACFRLLGGDEQNEAHLRWGCTDPSRSQMFSLLLTLNELYGKANA